MAFPLLAMALPSIIGGVAGLVSAKNQPKQQTQTQVNGGTSGYVNGSMLDPRAQAHLGYGLDQSRAQLDGGGVSPIFGQAQDAVGRGLIGQQNFGGYQGGGGYQARQVNPYADTAFNAAADATQNRLSGQFARSGRNIAASHPARSQELQHLAAGIYGPAYEAEAQRQYGSQESAAQRGYGAAEAGADRNLSAYGQALGSSPYFSQSQGGLALDQYLQRAQGLIGQMPQTQYGTGQSTGAGAQTQPIYNNPMASAAGGAMLGQSLFPGGFGGMMGQRAQPGIYDHNSGGYIPGT